MPSWKIMWSSEEAFLGLEVQGRARSVVIDLAHARSTLAYLQ